MWSTFEIIQFITLNFISIFFIYFSVVNYFKKDTKKIFKIIYINMALLNVIWIIVLYVLTFLIWTSSWGVNIGVNFGFIIADIIYFLVWIGFHFKKINNLNI